ncbi:MAG: NAD-dependent epimerase/dehydratase family protein [Gammaproteobacteria bacterium]|nr:NAD-dependent epimerase/dehydratase family protein [Gammaproteobacteria bacterium]
MRVLISGGSGQIGSHVAELLLARGDEVVNIDNLATGRPEHLPDQARLTNVYDTIADKALVDRWISDFHPDAIVHCAASYKDPGDWYNDSLTNAVGGANLIAAARANQVRRFIYFQTALCYGVKPVEQPITLNHPINPDNSSYSITKTTTEEFLRLSGIDYVTFRLANVIGPRCVSGPLPIFFQRLTAGKQCFVTKARRDFVFNSDLAAQVVRAIGGVGSGAYHFSSGRDIAIIDLYNAMVEAIGIKPAPQPEVRELSPDDAPSILLDPTRTFADFGEMKFTPLSELCRRSVEYYRTFGVQGGYTHLKHAEKK